MNILYAEYDDYCRELFAFALRQTNYTVYEAINGPQAIQIVREEVVDFILLNLRLPMMCGYDVARRLAQEAPATPIAFLSARDLRTERATAFDSSDMVVDYWCHPQSPQSIQRRIEATLQACRQDGIDEIRRGNYPHKLAFVDELGNNID